MANPFAQFAPRGVAPPPEEEVPAPIAPPPPAPDAPVVNDFADFAPPTEQEPAMEPWSTKVRGKTIEFMVPRGSSTAQVRALAKQAGVPDPENRALKYGGAAKEQKKYGAAEAALHHGVDFVMPLVDEFAAAADAAFSGRSYEDNMRTLEERSGQLYDQHPWAANTGRVVGTLGAIPLAVGSKLLQGGNWLNTSLRSAAAGVPYGAANAYATNPIDDRMNGVGTAAALGGAIGGLLPGATNLGVALGRRIDQRLGFSDFVRRNFMGQSPEVSGTQAAVDVMAARIPQDASQMRARAQEFRDTGHDPALVNVIDESGRGFVGAMARRPGPGREVAQRAFDERRLSMPERIDRNMVAAIERSEPNRAMRTELARPLDETVADLTEQRSAAIENAMSGIRGDAVPFTPRMVEILDTADGRRAIARAMRTVTDPATLDAMKKLPAMIKEIGKIDPRMPAPVRNKIIAEITRGGGLTVDIADRLARKFNALAETGDSDIQRTLRGFAREIRDEAKAASPAYRTAMEEYAKSSKTLDAVETGKDFLATNNADEFAARAGKLSDDPNVKLEPREFKPTPLSPDEETAASNFATTFDADIDQTVEDILRQGDDIASASGGKHPGPLSIGDVTDWVDIELHSQPGFREWTKKVFNEVNQRIGMPPRQIPQPSDRGRAMQGARRAVQQAAGENIANAPSVARRIAVSPEQAIRNNALFGEINAEALERAMGISERQLRDFAQIAPNTGSATAIRGQDDEAAAGMLQAAASIKTGNWAQGALAMLRSIGVRDQDAGRIVEMAVDPAQVDTLIDMLERSYGKQTAQKLSRVLALPMINTSSRTVGGSR